MSRVPFFEPISDERVYEFFAEFGGTEESVNNDVRALRQWIRKAPHLPTIEDDQWLLNFLLKCKNNLQTTKCKIEDYFVAKTLMPEVFQNRNPDNVELESTYRSMSFFPTRRLTPDGYRVVIMTAFETPKNSFQEAENFLKSNQLTIDVSLRLDRIRGVIGIINLENATPALLATVLPLLKKFAALTTKVTPNRIHHVYLLNTASYMDAAIMLGKSFVAKKLRERIEIWHDRDANLANVLPKEVLPSEFGGDEISLVEIRDLWYEELRYHREWIIESECHKADLDQMPRNATPCEHVPSFGVDGTFRKLCVD